MTTDSTTREYKTMSEREREQGSQEIYELATTEVLRSICSLRKASENVGLCLFLFTGIPKITKNEE